MNTGSWDWDMYLIVLMAVPIMQSFQVFLKVCCPGHLYSSFLRNDDLEIERSFLFVFLQIILILIQAVSTSHAYSGHCSVFKVFNVWLLSL